MPRCSPFEVMCSYSYIGSSSNPKSSVLMTPLWATWNSGIKSGQLNNMINYTVTMNFQIIIAIYIEVVACIYCHGVVVNLD